MAVLKDLKSMQAELDRVNALLLEAQSGGKVETVTIIEKHNAPFLEFKGNFIPFTLSLPKCRRLVKHGDSIAAFVKSDGKVSK